MKQVQLEQCVALLVMEGPCILAFTGDLHKIFQLLVHLYISSVCVCVCVREREREREKMCVCERERVCA